MENYRKKLRIQIWLNAAGALALIAVQVLAYTGVIRPLEGGGVSALSGTALSPGPPPASP